MQKKTPKQIVALLCAALLILLYLVTLLSAIIGFPGWQRLFGACLIATVALPILLWIYIRIYARIQEQKKEKPDSADES